MKKFLIFLLCCIACAALAIMIWTGAKLFGMFSEYHAGSADYENVRDAFFEDIDLSDLTRSPATDSPASEETRAAVEHTLPSASDTTPASSTSENDITLADSPAAENSIAHQSTAFAEPSSSIEATVSAPHVTQEETSKAHPIHSSETRAEETDHFVDYRIEQKLSVCGIPLDNIIVVRYQMNFDKLRQISSDVKGWISIENTYIDYPIVQTIDNEFYLRHTITGEWNNCGAIFIDSRNTSPFSEFVTFIYGHNQKNHQMFHDLLKYDSKEYWHDYQFINIYTPDMHYTWQIFSAYPAVTSDAAFTYHFNPEMAAEKKEAYLAAAREASLYDTGIYVTAEDRMITLVTCSNDAGTDERFVVHAKLISAVSTAY